ncbi:MAG: TniQ family protein [Algiphilus sp.]
MIGGAVARVPPLSGELTSSWLFRLAQSHGETPHGLAKFIWGEGSPWTRDLDRSLSNAQLDAIARFARTPAAGAKDTSLQAAESQCAGDERKRAIAPGVLAFGVHHRTRRLHGQQVCPDCLSQDKAPHLRRTWRLAFVFACVQHDRLLRDACPACDSPINAYRPSDVPLTHCGECGASLTRGKQARCDPMTLSTQKQLLQALHANRFMSGALNAPFADWLAGLRVMFGAAARDNGTPGLWQDDAATLADRGPQHPQLEKSRVERRAQGLRAVVSLSTEWPTRFLLKARQCDLTQGMVIHPRRSGVPTWLDDIVRAQLRPSRKRVKKIYKPPKQRANKHKALAHPDASKRISERLDRVLGARSR